MKVCGNKNNKIRLGIMCTGRSFKEWEARCLEDLLALEYVQPALLIIDGSSKKRSTLRYKIDKLVASPG